MENQDFINRMSNKHNHLKAYKVSFIAIALLIVVYNIYGVLFLTPVYLVLAISFNRAELDLTSAEKSKWAVTPFAVSILIVTIILILVNVL